MNFGDWLDEFIPPEYATYVPLVERVLGSFLGQIPHNAPVTDLPSYLRQCPTLHKLGQLLARDPRLGLELRQRLSSLESCLPLSKIEDYEWPPDLVPSLALAEGSVASVFVCRWGSTEVVAKRLKPGIEQQLTGELAIWRHMTRSVADWCQQDSLPSVDFESLVLSLSRLLQDELRPQQEQQQLQRAAQYFLNWPEIQVPQVYPQLLLDGVVMERLRGGPLLDHPDAKNHFALAIRVLLSDPFFSEDELGVFHLDPHPGNLWVTDEGRLALLDWGSTLSLSKHQRILLTQAILAAWRGDHQDWQLFAGQLSGAEVGPCPPAGKLSGLFSPACWGHRLPPELVLLRKILFHLEGIEAQIGQGDLLRHLFFQAGARFLSDLPRRFSAPSNWRGFATHLSNLDLLHHAVKSIFGSSVQDSLEAAEGETS